MLHVRTKLSFTEEKLFRDKLFCNSTRLKFDETTLVDVQSSQISECLLKYEYKMLTASDEHMP